MSPETASRFQSWLNSRPRPTKDGAPLWCDSWGTIWTGVKPNIAPVSRSTQISYENLFLDEQEGEGFQASISSDINTSALNLMDVVLAACRADKATAKLCLKKFIAWLDNSNS